MDHCSVKCTVIIIIIIINKNDDDDDDDDLRGMPVPDHAGSGTLEHTASTEFSPEP